MSEVFDITILGAGPVGLFGAFYAGLRNMKVKIIDSLPELGGQLSALYPEKFVYDMPGFPQVLAKDLAAQLIEQAMRFEPAVVLEETGSRLEHNGEHYVLTTDKGVEHHTKTLVIAAGAGAFSPKKLKAPGIDTLEGKGIYYGVRSKAVFENKKLLVVGGGDSALDWALNLEPLAQQITLIHRSDRFRAHEESVKQLMQSSVEVKTFWEVKEAHGEHQLEACTLLHNQTKEELKQEYDAVIFNLGFSADLGPIKDWGLELQGKQILVDAHLQTNRPGVFAAGDVAVYDGKLKLIATGVGEITTAVCFAKTLVDPSAKLFPGHSSDMELPGASAN